MTIHQIERLSPGDWLHDVRDQLKWHIYHRSEHAFTAGDIERGALRSAEAVADRQSAIREFILRSLGGVPSSDSPLNVRTMGELRRDGYRIEKLVYESRPRHYVTSLLYVPDGLSGPTAAVLFLCGHAAEGKAYPEYQRVCQLLALSGMVVLAQDPIGQGERLSYWEPAIGDATVGACTTEHDHAGAQCIPLGWNIARFLLHDAMRSLDLLAARPEVDASRIGLTGNSGGGTQSSLVMMADRRIAAAAPGTFIMDRRSYMHTGGAQDAEQIWGGFTAAGFDHADVLLSMAPKPVCVLAVTDDFFPIEGTRATVAQCRPIWEALGSPGMPMLVEDRSGHAYTSVLAEAAARFFGRALLGRDVEPDYGRTSALQPSAVQCTRSGQVREDMADARGVHEECVDRARTLAAKRSVCGPQGRRTAARSWLRERVLAHRTPCELNARSYGRGRCENLSFEARVWRSQPDTLGHGLLLRALPQTDAPKPVTIALWEGGTNCLQPHLEWLRATCAAGRLVVVLDVSGTGSLAPHSLLSGYEPLEFYGVIHKLADDLAWLDDSLAALRTYDVIRAVDMVQTLPDADPSDVRLHLDDRTGRQSIYGCFAAAVDDRIRGVDREGEMETYDSWVTARHYDAHDIKSILMPGMLEVFDLPDIV